MLDAMKKKKHVVTANKAAIAANFDKLKKCAKENNVMFKFEASVAGGIPVINAITSVLQGNQFDEVMGIVNGTTNYILTQMTDYGLEYDDVLKVAQEKGFAEADPTDDVEGIDVANKLTILMALMFDKYVKPGDIPTEGISKITKEQIEDAKAQGCKIKLLATARNSDGKFEYNVKPVLLKNDHPLCGVNNEFNAIFARGNAVGELMFYGKGAGPRPTGSAVMGDVIEIIRAMNLGK
jgi:homoserine dehydrogenase